MKDRSLLPLKLLVYGMGIVLVGGFVWVAALLASKVEQGSACTEITLPEGETRFADGFWIVVRDGEILRFDSCGKQVQRVMVTSWRSLKIPSGSEKTHPQKTPAVATP